MGETAILSRTAASAAWGRRQSAIAIYKYIFLGHYNVITIPSAEKLLKILEKNIPELILLDVEMPEMDGYEAIRRIKASPRTVDVPVIFLTARTDTANEIEGLSLGAIDYITKPFSPPLLLKRLEVHLLVERQKRELQHLNDNLMNLVAEKTRTVVTLKNAILKTVAELVEWRDDITGSHIERTQRYLKLLAEKAHEQGVYREEISSWDMDIFLQSAQLHDVGKLSIKDDLLCKPSKLTADEYEAMKEHTNFGVRIIDKIKHSVAGDAFLEHARIFAATHHEKWDGSGYPQGLSGEAIPLQGRLMAIADVYDALISARPYKAPFTHQEAVETILAGSGTHFDPSLVDIFALVQEEFRAASGVAQ